MLDELKNIAFRFQIDPKGTVGHAAKLYSVITVLQGIHLSYLNFLKVEFLRNDQFAKAYENNTKVFDTIREDLELLIVDLKFSSFEAAIAPDLTEAPTLFTNEVNQWKRSTFLDYKNNVLYADFEEPKYFQNTIKHYSDEERLLIYRPLFAVVGPDKSYRVNLIGAKGKKQILRQPDKVLLDVYLPRRERSTSSPADTKIVQFYARMAKEGDSYRFNRNTLKDVVYYEELSHETYPYKPDVINFEETTYVLNQRLTCEVTFDDETYFIHNDLLDITVWADSRDEAETAFAFAFSSLYINYVTEKDEQLSEEAKALKSTLLNLVKTIK